MGQRNICTTLAVLAGMALAACRSDLLLHSYAPLDAREWSRNDTVCFNLPRQEEQADGYFSIGLRATAPVGIRQVVLAVELCLDTPRAYRCDTVFCPLTDADGNTLGKGLNTVQYESTSLPLHMQKGQGGTVRIHHLMREETLGGFTELGIKVSRQSR